MNRQDEIKNWFDRVYEKRGHSYLRPIESYYIFPTILDAQPGQRLLDIACGPGLLIKASERKEVTAHGIDISEVAVKQAVKRCPTADIQVGNAEKLPYENGYFNLVTCIGSLERMLDRSGVLSEVCRVLSSSGKACFMVRNSEHIIWRYLLRPLGLQNRKGHQDALNLRQWTTLFTENGFRIAGIFPDHWPYFRWLQILQPWKKIDTSMIQKLPWKLENSYEFIFLLEKQENA